MASFAAQNCHATNFFFLRRFKNEGISEGVGVVFRGVFPEALGKIGELLKSNSRSVEQAVSYFRRSFIYGRLNVF